jgi:hypothetical protein
MDVRGQSSNLARLRVFRHAAVRTGVYCGAGLSLVSIAWLLIANRVTSLESFAFERNLSAAGVLGVFALVPVIRFLRLPGNLLISGVISWTLLSVTYFVMGLYFWGLGERYTASHIFILGTVVYMIAATLSWIGTCIWRARQSHTSHSRNHAS